HGKSSQTSSATGAAQGGFAAAARGMRGVPGLRGRVIAQAGAVVMPDHRGAAVTALRPVAAGPVFRPGVCHAVGLRAGEDVVHVGRVPGALADLPFFGQRGLLVEVVVAMKLLDIARDDDAFRVLPGAVADALARMLRRRVAVGARAEIGPPDALARPLS